MLWERRFQRKCIFPVTGLLLVLMLWQTAHEFLGFNIIPSLINKAEAAYDSIQPNGDGSVTSTQVTCGGLGNFDCIDDGTATSGTPSTGGDYLNFATGNQDYFSMQTISGVDTVDTIYVPVYHEETRNNMQLAISLWNDAETVQYGTTQNLAYSATPVWGTANFTGLSLTQAQLDGLKMRINCNKIGGGPDRNCLVYSAFATVNYSEVINLTVASLGSQQNLDVGTTSAHVGGAFSILGGGGTWPVTTVTIAEQGTVDASTDLANIKLFYDLDTIFPYDCADQSYDGTEPQFGSTVTGGFSGANGTATFTQDGGINVSSTQAICLYPVLDVLSSAGAGETIEIQITNPTTDVSAPGSPIIIPATPVLLSGTTVLQKTVLTQENYIWRNDDGNESSATAASDENTPYQTMPKDANRRLRLAVFNDGNKTSDPAQYRLEYASKVTTCSVASGWTDVGVSGGDFNMSSTIYYTDGDNSTDIVALTNPDTNHQDTNGGLKDTSSQTGNITLTSTQFVELEYSIRADPSVADGNTYCFRVTNAGTPISYTNYPEATIAADLLVTTSGTQVTSANIPSTNNYAGGRFIITDNSAGIDTITSITITGGGTVDLENDISNVRLRYDYDTTFPYTCDDQSYSGGDTAFGSPTSFNNSGKATFSGTATTSPTQTICLYVEYDVGSGASNGETILISIADPSTEIVAGSASIAPASPVNISGSTELASADVGQFDYHWRNNNGNETGATSATGGNQNTPLTELAKNTAIRVRMSVANTGLASAAEAKYRLEWRQKVTTCDIPTGWARVDATGDEWEMAPTGNLNQGDDTTDISLANGGVGDPAGNFLSDNNGVADDIDNTASSTLPADNYLDVEYSIRATNLAVQGAIYCFRITDNGTALDNYFNYPEATIKLDTDFKIQRGVVTATGAQVTISAGTDYEAPASASSSFIRITNTQLTGAGPNTGNGNSNADDVTIYITNPDNILNNIIFERAPFPAGNTRISWEIVEYTGVAGGENEIIVRNSASITYIAGSLTASGPTVSSVIDNSDVVAFITSQYNPDAGRNSFHLGLSTSAWNTSTNQVNITRGATGNASIATYSLVEFTGSNWNINRVEKNSYTAASSTETVAISPSLTSLARSFLHVQKRTAQNNHSDFGHEVWLSSIGAVSFMIDGAATTPANHASVAWIIENTQTQGQRMVVTRSSGSLPNAGAGPESNVMPIGKTLNDLNISSLFVNNRGNDASRSWPEPILGATILSPTTYELWRSDTTSNIVFRTEVVEWPTAARKLTQNYFWLYSDNDEIKPADPWPPGPENLGENTPMTADDGPMAPGDKIRIRMSLSVSASSMPAGLDSFKLVYGKQVTTCSAISTWHDVGGIGSTTAPWRGFDNTPADGTPLSTDPPLAGDLLISIGTVAGTYEEQNPSALNPYTAFPGDEVVYDWVVQHNGADDKSSYCFRMDQADGTPLETPNIYPIVRTVGFEPVITNWRWYDDETNLTPTTALALENVAPVDIQNQNAIKLRLVLEESSGAPGTDLKFALQFSEYADFSQSVATVTATSTCMEDSLWCFFDGAGVDNEIIDSAVISDADSCVAGVGNGCGSYNESTSTIGAIVDQPAFASTEYEFTIIHAGARANAVYYFRLYDITNQEFVSASSSYPSLVTEGAQLVSTLSGVPLGTTIAGVTSDVTTTPDSIAFGSLPFGTSYVAIQELTIDTNATEGYQLLMYATQQLTNTYGDEIPPISATNASPAGWNTACTSALDGCFGYHTTDATLVGGSGRFGPIDSYAALSTTPEEVMYSSIPNTDIENIIFRIQITEGQPAGDYQTGIVYIAVPTF